MIGQMKQIKGFMVETLLNGVGMFPLFVMGNSSCSVAMLVTM